LLSQTVARAGGVHVHHTELLLRAYAGSIIKCVYDGDAHTLSYSVDGGPLVLLFAGLPASVPLFPAVCVEGNLFGEGVRMRLLDHYVGFLLRTRALVLAGRATPAAGAPAPLAWLAGTAPLWPVVEACAMLREGYRRAR
jgi:hypothetical protein